MKTNLDKEFKTDKEIEQEGLWVSPMPNVRFRVRRYGGANNTRIKSANLQFIKPEMRRIQAGTISDTELENLNLKAFISACLAGWEGITDEEGKDIPFDTAVAYEVLQPLPDLCDVLFKAANNFTSYKEDLGNSSANT